MKKYSIWKDTVKMKSYSKLEKDIDTDVLIIGGGITGINTLFQLEKSNMEVVMVEQNKIGMGVTANTTGKLNFLQDSVYEKIIKNYNEKKASEYLKSQTEAIRLAVDLIRKHEIACDLEETNAYVYTDSGKDISDLEKFAEFLHHYGIETFDGSYPLVKSKYMLGVENTYLFHPLKFLNGLLDQVYHGTIYEDTSIQKIEKGEDFYICYTKEGYQIKTKWVVIASHYPYFNLPYLFPIRGSLEKSYLSASIYKSDPISLITYKKPVISIRDYQDYLLYLSNSHTNSNKVDDKKNYQELMKKVNDLGLFPDYLWSNIDIITNDGLPYIGKVEDQLLIGTGYNTWGMTNGILAGKILRDIILGNNNPYIDLFSPRRFSIGDVVAALSDGKDSIVGYVNGYFSDSENIKYQMIDGKEVATYCDEKGEHKVYTKCPHMGCRLIFNEVECTWDCPCHASRFDVDGKCMSGPSNEDITYKS